MMDPSEEKEPHDGHVYNLVMLYRETVVFFVKCLNFYKELIEEDLSVIDEDKYLSDLITEDVKREYGLSKESNELVSTLNWLERELAKTTKDSFSCDISMSHRNVRYIKSVCSLYIKFLYLRRNELSTKPNISAKTLEAVDGQITKLEELLNSGVFSNASKIPLLIDQFETEQNESTEDIENKSIANAKRPKPVFVDSIEILDSELRGRCLDLFNHFKENEQPERHDTVVTEATRILENRLRKLTRTSDGSTGADLAAKAFSGKKPMYQISSIPSEQESAHLLFRGAFGFIRNRAHHKLLNDLAPERVLQILGFIDYLISIAESSQLNEEK